MKACTVCVAATRADIEADLTNGVSLRKIETFHAVSRSALDRHRKAGHNVSNPLPTGRTETKSDHVSELSETNVGVDETEIERVPEGSSQRADASGLTAPMKRALMAYVSGASVKKSAEAGGVTDRQFYNWRKHNNAFMGALESAQAAQDEILERRLSISASNDAMRTLTQAMQGESINDIAVKSAGIVISASSRIAAAKKTSKVDVNVAVAPMIVIPEHGPHGKFTPPWKQKTLMPIDGGAVIIDGVGNDDVVDAELSDTPVDTGQSDEAFLKEIRPESLKQEEYQRETEEALAKKLHDKQIRMAAAPSATT